MDTSGCARGAALAAPQGVLSAWLTFAAGGTGGQPLERVHHEWNHSKLFTPIRGETEGNTGLPRRFVDERCVHGDVAKLCRTVCPGRFGQASPPKASKNKSKNIARGSCSKPWGASVAEPRLWRTLNLLQKLEAALSGAYCGGRVGPDGSFFRILFLEP